MEDPGKNKCIDLIRILIGVLIKQLDRTTKIWSKWCPNLAGVEFGWI